MNSPLFNQTKGFLQLQGTQHVTATTLGPPTPPIKKGLIVLLEILAPVKLPEPRELKF